MKIRSLITMIALLAGLLATSFCSAQREERQEVANKEEAVSAKSPAVSLKSVGRLVARGTYEVSPSAIRGKRLTISPGDGVIKPSDGVVKVCIGHWDGTACNGTYLEIPIQN